MEPFLPHTLINVKIDFGLILWDFVSSNDSHSNWQTNFATISLLGKKTLESNRHQMKQNGLTPLHVAAHYNHVNIALLLLDHGASPHAAAKVRKLFNMYYTWLKDIITQED